MDVLEGDPLGSYRIISRPQVCVLENDSFTVSLPAAGRTGRKIDLSAKVGPDGNGKLRLDATVITYTEPSADEKHPPGVRVLNEVESTQLSGTFQKGQAIRFRLDQTEAGATRWAELRVMRIAGEAIAPEAVPAAGADAALRLKASRVHLPQDRINSSALSKTAAALAGESSPQPAAAPGTTDAVPVLDKDPVTRVFRNVGVAPSGARIGVPAPRPIATVAHAAVAPPEPKPGTRIYQVELAVFEGDHLGSEEEGTLRCLNRPTIAVVEGHSLSFICNPVDVTTELFGSVRSAPEGKAFVDLALRRSIHDSSPAGRSGSATERRVTRTEERVIQNEQRPLEHVDSCRLEGAFLLGRTIKLPLSKTDKGEPRWAEFRVTEVDPVGANAPPRTSEIKVGDIINVIVEDAGPDNTALSENIADLMIETTQPKPAPQARAQGVVPILGELPVTSPLFKKPRDSAPVRIGREPEDATAARIPILEKIPYIAGLFPNTASRVAMVGTVGTVDRRSSADSAGVPQPIVLHKDPATGLFRNVGVAPPAGRGEVAPAAFADASAKHVDEPLITATYAIHDLPLWHHHDGQSEHPACEALIRLIKGTIDPESWERGASIREFETTLSLVVRQTQANHDRIAKLIGLLRPEKKISRVDHQGVFMGGHQGLMVQTTTVSVGPDGQERTETDFEFFRWPDARPAAP
ncbi:MAG: hypothetical protein WED34_13095 [Planctomycetales bacterium]